MQKISILILLSVVCFAACDSPTSKATGKVQKKDPKKYNVVEKFVRSPLDQANQSAKSVEDRNKRMLDAAGK